MRINTYTKIEFRLDIQEQRRMGTGIGKDSVRKLLMVTCRKGVKETDTYNNGK